MLALREHIEKYKDPKEAEKNAQQMKIHMKHFKDAMKKIRPLSNRNYPCKNIASKFDPRLTSTNTMPKSRIDDTCCFVGCNIRNEVQDLTFQQLLY